MKVSVVGNKKEDNVWNYEIAAFVGANIINEQQIQEYDYYLLRALKYI